MAMYLRLPGKPHEPEYEAALRRRIVSIYAIAILNITVVLVAALEMPAKWSVYFWAILVLMIALTAWRLRAVYRLYDTPPFPANLEGMEFEERQRQIRGQILRTFVALAAVVSYMIVHVILFGSRRLDYSLVVLAILVIVYIIVKLVSLYNLLNDPERLT